MVERIEEVRIIIPRLIAWEVIRSCNLLCSHCRASALNKSYPDELTTDECLKLIDDISSFCSPILILTGGEPLLRGDIFDIAKYAKNKGMRVVMATNGTLLDKETTDKIYSSGISRISVSIDFPDAEGQDKFRGSKGAYDKILEGIRNANISGLEVQINTTVTALNVQYLDEILKLSLNVGAVAFHLFMLVPTGRGKELCSVELSPKEYERVLNWVYDRQRENKIFLKPTDVPHYFRVVHQRAKKEGIIPKISSQREMEKMTRGCLGGIGFCFISHTGNVQPCGYFDLSAGNVRKTNFKDIWFNSKLFQDLRDYSKLKGKCGICEYKEICGGCRARAYEKTGDYLEEEGYCIYKPKKWIE